MSTTPWSADPAAVECEDRFLTWFARHPGPWYALAWLPVLLVAPVVTALQRADAAQVIGLLTLGVLHGATVLLRHRAGPRWRAEVLVMFSTLAVAGYQVLWNDHQVFLYPLLAIGMAVGIRRHRAMGFVGALAVSGAVASGIAAGDFEDALIFGFTAFLAGTSAHLIDYLVETTAVLAATRERLAHTAIAEERQRFSRDLHDLLGHTLSVIVVKAEAVRRFAPADPAAAAEHARGIEEIGRTALAEVRQAVVGYRDASLDHELAAARTALEDAGLRVRIEDGAALPAPVDRLFAWVVREGTTNILRHARARSCAILVETTGGEATVEITDDGRPGPSAGPGWPGATHRPVPSGSGLSGLRERAERLGGVLVADRTPTGFRLGVSVPVGDGEQAS